MSDSSPWGNSFSPPPLEVAELAAVVVDAVRHRFGVDLDLTSETLPFLDELMRENRSAPGGVKQLFAYSAGAYLGETLRRAFGGIWDLAGEPKNPENWSVRFLSCPLALRAPQVGVEILTESMPEEPSLVVSPSFLEILEKALSQAAPLRVEEYFSFCGRYDAMHLAIDVLTETERLMAENEKRAPRWFGYEDPARLV